MNRDIGTGKVDRALKGTCPECGFAIDVRYSDGTQICTKGHESRREA